MLYSIIFLNFLNNFHSTFNYHGFLSLTYYGVNDTGSHTVDQADLEFTIQLRLALNWWQSSHFSLPSVGFAGVSHHIWFQCNLQNKETEFGYYFSVFLRKIKPHLLNEFCFFF